MSSLSLVTHILPKKKKKKEKKKSIHTETTSTFLAQFLASWQNGDGLIWCMAITFFAFSAGHNKFYIEKRLHFVSQWPNYGEMMAQL